MERIEVKVIHDKIIDWIKDWFKYKNGPAIVGISGGKDSTICAALLAEALGSDRVIGVMMPNGEQKDINDSKKVCELLGIKNLTVNIGNTYKILTGDICVGIMNDVSDGNLKNEIPSLYSTNTPARLRMTTLYGVAAIFGGFVGLIISVCISKDNFSEDFVGYSTKYGDAAGDFSLLNRLTKTEVVELGDYMNLPKELVHKTPSDGMCGKSDEDNMGFTYETLDNYLLDGLPPKSLEVYNKIMAMHNNPNTKYKCIDMPSALSDIRTASPEFIMKL